jgi:hypothetical protein
MWGRFLVALVGGLFAVLILMLRRKCVLGVLVGCDEYWWSNNNLYKSLMRCIFYACCIGIE